MVVGLLPVSSLMPKRTQHLNRDRKGGFYEGPDISVIGALQNELSTSTQL